MIADFARPAFERALAPLVEQLTDEVIATAYKEGQSMSDSEAVAYGLSTIEQRAPL